MFSFRKLFVVRILLFRVHVAILCGNGGAYMISVPKNGEKIRSKFNGREFIIDLVGERMIVLEERSMAIKFVTTIDNLRSFYEYARNENFFGATKKGGLI